MIAYHFPPVAGSSGVHRALKFSQYLPEHGWQPLVLSVTPGAYQHTSPAQLADIRPDIVVRRAFALDTARHLSLKGRYPGWLALPDNWASWVLSAVPAGLMLALKYRPDVLWSTFPIATSHLIGLTLRRLTGIPWVADFRDPMTDVSYPGDPVRRRAHLWIERQTLKRCARAVMTTPGTLERYVGNFPDIPRARYSVIANGYDEENFRAAEAQAAGAAHRDTRITLVHSGLLYPQERDPRALFAALARLRASGLVSAADFRIVLRATGHDDYLRPLIAQHGITDVVALEPAIAYRLALEEMLRADGLLVLQASDCNHQIPAKLYEYIRARRPILALTDAVSDTAAVMREAGLDTVAPLSSEAAIVEQLQRFIGRIRAGTAARPSEEAVARNSRRARTAELARLFDSIG